MKHNPELENFIRERFDDIIRPGEMELIYQPNGFERLKQILRERSRESARKPHTILSPASA